MTRRSIGNREREWFLAVLKTAGQKLIPSYNESELGKTILEQIASKVGGVNFSLKDAEDLNFNVYSLIEKWMGDLGWFIEFVQEQNLNIEQMRETNIPKQANDFIFLAISCVLDCEVRIFDEVRETKVVGEGKRNCLFGKLELCVNEDGQIGNETGHQSNVRKDSRLKVPGRIHSTSGIKPSEGSLAGKREGTWCTTVGNWILEIEVTDTDDGRLHSCLVKNVFQQMDTGGIEVWEVGDVLEQIDKFFEEYGERIRILDSAVNVNENALQETWKIVSKLAAILNREIIVFMEEGDEIVLGVTERIKKFQPFTLVAEVQRNRIWYYGIKSSRQIQSWNVGMNIVPAIDIFDEKTEEITYNQKFKGSESRAVIKLIDGDGSCLIRSLLDQMGRIHDKYYMSDYNVLKLRNNIASYIDSNRERFEEHLFEHIEEAGSYERAIESIREKSFWLGEEAILIFADFFGKQIEVYKKEGLRTRIGVRMNNEPALRIYYTGTHYNSIIDIVTVGTEGSDTTTSSNEVCHESVNNSSIVRSEEAREGKSIVKEVIENNNEVNNSNISNRSTVEAEDEINEIFQEQRKQEEAQMSQKKISPKKARSRQKNNARDNKGHQGKTTESLNRETKALKFVTWNVRGCRQHEKREQIDDILMANEVMVAGLQEVNTLGDEINTSNYMWKVVGNHDNKARGLAIVVKKGQHIRILQVKERKKGILWAKLIINGVKLIVINVHAPNKNQKTFLSNLNEIVSRERDRKSLIVLGDFNAQIGSEDLRPEDKVWIGSKLYHELCNENGELLKCFLHLSKLKNVSSKIGKDIETTRRSKPKGGIYSQIDHVLVPQFTTFKIRYVKGFWTENLETDHKMIVVGLVLSNATKVVKSDKEPTKVNIELLKIPEKRKLFKEKLQSIPTDRKSVV